MEKRKPTDRQPATHKEPYDAPAVLSEEVFETLALTCGKLDTPLCLSTGGFSS